MSSQGVAVQDRLGDTADHAMPARDKAEQGAGGPFLYASGSQPLAGYTIKRGVGSGGFGEVYYAISDAGKEVALKLIRRNLDTELRGMRQCLNLKHPNLLSLYDIRQDDAGGTWVVMEYMSGRSLESEIADHPQGLPLDEAMNWFHGIAAGVAYLHDHGIVHRDLKPGNIFCDEGVVKVGDYGLSKFISCSRRSGHTESIGTVHYMAPEVAHGRYGKELDVYAFGAVLYELLTGHVPFDGESVGEVLMKHLTAQPDVSKLAEPYRSVVARALEKDPARRFATVGEMAAALPGGAGVAPANGGAMPVIMLNPSPDVRDGESQSAMPTQSPAGVPPTRQGPRPGPAPVHVFAEEPAASEDQEPIAQYVALQLQRARQRWQQSKLHPGAKRLIVVFAILALLVTPQAWLPAGVFLLIVYGGYRLVRFIYRLCFCTTPVARPAVAVPTAARAPRPLASTAAAPAFIVKPLAVRMTELIGSLLAAAAVTAAMCVAMYVLETYHGMPMHIEQCAWLYLVSLAGAWIVIVVSKFWEGSRGERLLRHFILMTIGFGMGLAAFGAAEVFCVRLPADHTLTMGVNQAAPIGFPRRSTRTGGRRQWPTWRFSPRSWAFCAGGWMPIPCAIRD